MRLEGFLCSYTNIRGGHGPYPPPLPPPLDAAVPHGAEVEADVDGAVGALPGGVDVSGVVREGAAQVVREHRIGVGHVAGVDLQAGIIGMGEKNN